MTAHDRAKVIQDQHEVYGHSRLYLGLIKGPQPTRSFTILFGPFIKLSKK
jgi:hypothetical protein